VGGRTKEKGAAKEGRSLKGSCGEEDGEGKESEDGREGEEEKVP
jgi:hypothetical protein